MSVYYHHHHQSHEPRLKKIKVKQSILQKLRKKYSQRPDHDDTQYLVVF